MVDKFRGFVLLKDDPRTILVGCVEHLATPGGFVEFALAAVVTCSGWSARPSGLRLYIPHENVKVIGVLQERLKFGNTPYGWFDKKGVARL